MLKNEFLESLQSRLEGLPREDVEKTIEYYCEMIDERMEDGLLEQEAVAGVGTVDEAVASVLGDIPLPKLIRKKVTLKRSLKVWEIVLIILSLPIWLPLLIGMMAIAVSVYIAIWAMVLSFYACVLSTGFAAIASFAAVIPYFAGGSIAIGMTVLAMGLVSAGITILFFHFSNLMAKGAFWLGKQMIKGIKSLFVGKGD